MQQIYIPQMVSLKGPKTHEDRKGELVSLKGPKTYEDQKGEQKDAMNVEMKPLVHHSPLRAIGSPKSPDGLGLSKIANPEQLIQCTRL